MEDFYKIFVNAFEFFLEKRYLDSLTKLNEAEKTIGNDSTKEFSISLENLKGFNYLALNYIDYARECFEKSLSYDSNSSQACAGLGELFFLDKKDKEAKSMYEWAVRNNPENQFAVNGLAKVNEILGLSKDHNSLDEKVVEKVNENIREIINSFTDLYENGKYSEAIKNINVAEKVVELEIEEQQELLAEMMNMKGTALLKLDEIEAAQDAFEKALRFQSESSHACWGLAEIFYQNQKYTEAKTMYEWAVKNNTENSAAIDGLSKVNKTLNLPEDDNVLLEDETKNLQNKIDDMLVEAYDQFQSKEYNNSLLLLTQIEEYVIQNGNDNLPEILSSVKNFKGFNYLALNKLEDARTHFENSLNINPLSSQACAGLGEILFVEGKDSDAKVMFEFAVKNNPKNAFGIAGLEKVNKLLNLQIDHNSLTEEPALTLSSGRTITFKGK